MLHIVNKSPYEANSLELCLQYAILDSDVLLIENGVYAAIKGTSVEPMIAASNGKIYVLGPDLKARGIESDKLLKGISIVDYDGFVKLASDHSKVQSWL